MTVKAKRQALIIYLTVTSDRKVKALYTLLETDINEHRFTLTSDHIDILEKRRADFLAGKAKPQPWQEVHARIRNKRKNV